MVVPAGREERRGAPGLLHLEPEHVAVEGDGPVEVGDPQVDVPDVGAGIDRLCHAGESCTREDPDDVRDPGRAEDVGLYGDREHGGERGRFGCRPRAPAPRGARGSTR